ncbi:AraC family transcriptional regulator [Micromonospora sp. KC723]|uniref:AraC family transcriptional regulator n=1 Tax=Micromonospora sp. KC723 TaxID=2530381 RepID=UPI00104B110B|nr:AraC family transcriptional regulator [Micromonospora sp. KC723]TDB73002.1 AraC family transcriptional regulator [Micromonospora sp. KC723]
MDPIDDVLRGVRASGADFTRTELSPPWSLRIADAASLTLWAPLRGEGWLSVGDDEEPRLVRAGDTAIVRGPGPVVLADQPRPAPSAVTSRTARTVLLTGTYHVRGAVAQRLLEVLPPVLVVPDSDGCATIREFLDTQAGACPPGRQIVRDRLVDWLMVCTLREWLDQRETVAAGWVRGLDDDVVGPVLRAMHAAPGRPWTLAALAREARVARTTLVDRFGRLVGEPPLTYLTHWRMSLAADLLTGSAMTVGAVAHEVGYADPFGFSAAFKRVHGLSPTAYRRTCRADLACAGVACGT